MAMPIAGMKEIEVSIITTCVAAPSTVLEMHLHELKHREAEHVGRDQHAHRWPSFHLRRQALPAAAATSAGS